MSIDQIFPNLFGLLPCPQEKIIAQPLNLPFSELTESIPHNCLAYEPPSFQLNRMQLSLTLGENAINTYF